MNVLFPQWQAFMQNPAVVITGKNFEFRKKAGSSCLQQTQGQKEGASLDVQKSECNIASSTLSPNRKPPLSLLTSTPFLGAPGLRTRKAE